MMRDDTTRQRRGPRANEEITVSGNALVDKVKELIHEGNVRRLIIRRPSGEALMEIPLSAGVGVAALLTLLAPVIAALAALGALIAQLRVEIERESDQSEQLPGARDIDHEN